MANRFLNNIKINDSYELPPADGTENQIIVTDGAGNLSFNDLSTVSGAVEGVQSDILYYEVKNSTGTTIETFKGVMAVGTDGNSGHILIDEMVADGTVEARYFLGITQEAIPNGGIGRVIAFGEIDQVNTNAFPDGTVLWCDPATPGDFTATEPDGPNLKIPAAFVLNQATNGKIQVRVQGNEGIKDLYDTKITSQVDGDVLVWKDTEGIWQNNSTLNVDYAASRVGIGTTDPDTKLDVVGRAVIGTGNTLTNATNATVIGNSNNLTNDSIVDSNTNLVLGDYGAGRYGNTVISDKTLRLGRADVINATSFNTTGVLNFNDSVQANSAFSNVGGLVGYFPPPTTTNDYYFFNAYSENVLDSVFQTGASPTASRYNMSTSPSLNCIFQKFDANTTNAGAVYINASNNSPTPSSRGIVTFDIRHQNQNSTVPDGHSLFEVTSGYGQTKFLIKQVSGSTNVGIGTTNPSTKLHVGNGTADDAVRVYFSDNNYAEVRGYGMQFSRAASYLRPTTDKNKSLNIGSDGHTWNQARVNTNEFTIEKDTSTFVKVDSSGNVGIGTTSPATKLSVNGTTQLNGEVSLPATGTATASVNYPSQTLRFSTSAWDTNNSTARAVHWNIKNEGSSTVYPDGTLTFYEESPSYDHWKLKLPGRGSGASYIHPDAALFNGSINIYESDTSNLNISLHPGGNSYFNGGNVGIGTTSPGYKLDVNGSLHSTNLTIADAIYHEGDSNTYIQFVANDTIRWVTSGAERMRLNSSGNVGVGTTNPNSKLHVKDGDITIEGLNTSRYLRFIEPDGTFQGGYVNYDGTSNILKIGVHNATDANTANDTDAIAIKRDTGYVGIGTPDPGQKLEVEGNIRLSKSNDATSGFELGRDGSTLDAFIIQRENADLFFRTNNSERMRIEAGGNVGIGVTVPQAKLHVANGLLRTWTPTSGTTAIFESTANNRSFVTITGANEAELWFGDAATQTKGRIRYEMANNKMEFWVGAAEKAFIDSSANLHVDGDVVAYSASISDIRLKDNINTIDSALDKVKKLRGVEYTWNAGSRKNKKDLGVIAQEVEEVLPDIVYEHKMDFIDEQVYKTVDYEKITAVLIEAIKEQQKQIDELKKQLDANTK